MTWVGNIQSGSSTLKGGKHARSQQLTCEEWLKHDNTVLLNQSAVDSCFQKGFLQDIVKSKQPNFSFIVATWISLWSIPNTSSETYFSRISLFRNIEFLLAKTARINNYRLSLAVIAPRGLSHRWRSVCVLLDRISLIR